MFFRRPFSMPQYWQSFLQKFRTTTLPFKPDRLTTPPSSVPILRSLAIGGFLKNWKAASSGAPAAPAGQRPLRSQPATTIITKAAEIKLVLLVRGNFPPQKDILINI